MNRHLIRAAWIIASLLVPGQLPAAESVSGTVLDRSGGVVPGAIVQVLKDERLVIVTHTGAKGDFSLFLPPNAAVDREYTILAVASGFAPATESLRPPFSANLNVTLVLEIAPYRQSVEIEAAIPPNEAVLDMSGVRESAAKDVGEALTALDGVFKIRKAGIASDLVIDGFQQNNIVVLVDGSRTYGACPDHMDPPAEHVDFAEVDHVEVSKGAFDMADQGALGAVVNVITKAPGPGFSFRPSLSGGSFDYVNPSVTASYGGSTIQVLGGYSFRSADPYQDGSGHAFTDYANYSASGKQQRAFDINTGWLETGVTISDRQQISVDYTRQQAGLILYPYLMMDSDHDTADRATLKYSARDLTPALTNLRLEGYFTQVSHFMSDDQRTTAMDGTWSMAADASSRTIGGRMEGDLGAYVTVGLEAYQRMWNMLSYANMSGMTTVTPSIPDVTTQSLGTFLHYEHALTQAAKLSTGVRFDHARMGLGSSQVSTDPYYEFHGTRRTGNSDNYASGFARVSLASGLFAGVGTTGRVPDAEERYINNTMGGEQTVGNPLLGVTRNTELSMGWTVNRKRFYLRPAIFYSFLDNFILVDNEPQMNGVGGSATSMAGMGTPSPTTARSYTDVSARIYGGQVGYGVTFTDALSLQGGGSETRGLATPEPAANVMSKNLPEMPPQRLWSALRYTRSFAFAELEGVLVNRQSHVDSDLNESPTPGYSLLNLRLGFTHSKVSGSFTLDNLLDRMYYEYLSYYRDPFASGVKIPEPGRTIFGQLRVSF